MSSILNTTQDVSCQPEISLPIKAPIVSTTPALTTVMVCMAIMAVCAVAYFAIHCYLEERQFRRKGFPPCMCTNNNNAADVNQIELGTNSERLAGVNIAVQTIDVGNMAEQFASWTNVHMPVPKQSTCNFTSPMTSNGPVPYWRPPATGSSRCHIDAQRKHRRRYRRCIPPSTVDVPSITIHSPSSSDSYSVLTNSRNCHSMSKSIIRDLTNLSSPTEGDVEEVAEEVPQMSPFHPRYNTPVSENAEEREHQMNAEGGQDPKDLEAASPEPTAASSTRDVASQPSANFHLKSLQTLNAERKEAIFENHASPTMVMPHFETMPGGKLVTRWTQTENEAGSMVSLDWDPYESERLRSADPNDEGSLHEELQLHMSGLMISHTSDATLHASRISNTAVSPPYVVCYECSDEFGVDDRNDVFGRSPRNSHADTRYHEPLDLRTSSTPNSAKRQAKRARK